jgi:hypothetical protein
MISSQDCHLCPAVDRQQAPAVTDIHHIDYVTNYNHNVCTRTWLINGRSLTTFMLQLSIIGGLNYIQEVILAF